MKNQERLATKAQAEAVRAYLDTLGAEVSHVQALEIIARGQGMRSRHLLETAPARVSEASAAALPTSPVCTRVSYRYVDASNCKRFSSTVFRGRFTKKQLQFIVSKLDEGEYFLPTQIGLENLVFAFDTDGDDHAWHKLELRDEADWVVDADGYVLCAGDIEVSKEANAIEFATDADCNNLFLRFARLEGWDETLQWWLGRNVVEADDEEDRDVLRLAGQQLYKDPEFQRVPSELLDDIFKSLGATGFRVGDKVGQFTKQVGTNAQQVVTLAVDGQDLQMQFNVHAARGAHLTNAPVWALQGPDYSDVLVAAKRTLDEQRRAAWFNPAVWSPTFE